MVKMVNFVSYFTTIKNILFYFIIYFILFYLFLRPLLWHMEVPWPEAKSELQLWAYAMATAHWIQAASVSYTAAVTTPDP